MSQCVPGQHSKIKDRLGFIWMVLETPLDERQFLVSQLTNLKHGTDFWGCFEVRNESSPPTLESCGIF